MNFEEKRCPHCGALLVENASFCPYCESVLIEKRPAEMPKPKRRRRITAALLLAAILVVTLTAVGFANRGKIIDAQGAELTYEADGQTFHLALSFESQGGAPFFGQPLFTVEVLRCAARCRAPAFLSTMAAAWTRRMNFSPLWITTR